MDLRELAEQLKQLPGEVEDKLMSEVAAELSSVELGEAMGEARTPDAGKLNEKQKKFLKPVPEVKRYGRSKMSVAKQKGRLVISAERGNADHVRNVAVEKLRRVLNK